MIKSIEAKFFRKHEDLKIDFSSGLNVLRGPNEIGKTTVTEIILYALYGAASLVDKLEETVTWGKKESDLRVKLVISISGCDYVFTRSKAGAEVNYAGVDGKPVKVTGQKEVTAFAAALLGADAKTASVLMLSSQAGLRGALDEGPAAVSALMGKLADFDTIDHLLKAAAETLALGSIVPPQAKLADADAEVLAATEALLDPEELVAVENEIKVSANLHLAAVAHQDSLCLAVETADEFRDDVLARNVVWSTAQESVVSIQAKLDAERSKVDRAVCESRGRPAAEEINVAREALLASKNHAAVAQAYAKFSSLGVYPVVSWDKDEASFNAEFTKATVEHYDCRLLVGGLAIEIESLRSTLISGDGKCPTCGHLAENHDHVTQRNAEVKLQVDAVRMKWLAASTKSLAATNDLTDLNVVSAHAKRRATLCEGIAQYLVFDVSVYPPRVEWNGVAPDMDGATNLAKLQQILTHLENRLSSAQQAEGRAAAHRAQVVETEAALATAKVVATSLTYTATEPIQAIYDKAYQVYAEQGVVVRSLADKLFDLRAEQSELVRQSEGAAARVAAAKARVVEYVSDIKTMEFNNELVRKLKSMKPMITDFLWNNVLAAVGNFFSVLRGEQSIVTKDATGFKVNGRGGSLSGSTLDMLALAIRVALSKTFVPHANFMVLDEPAHGCDNVRASALLGFLSGVGFEQTILASHDELSESVADHVINLGT